MKTGTKVEVQIQEPKWLNKRDRAYLIWLTVHTARRRLLRELVARRQDGHPSNGWMTTKQGMAISGVSMKKTYDYLLKLGPLVERRGVGKTGKFKPDGSWKLVNNDMETLIKWELACPRHSVGLPCLRSSSRSHDLESGWYEIERNGGHREIIACINGEWPSAAPDEDFMVHKSVSVTPIEGKS